MKAMIRPVPDKHYNQMARMKKRQYKRWLFKNKLWDGAIVIETLTRKKLLTVKY